FRGNGGGAWVLGALAGYNKSDVSFDATAGDQVDIGVWNIGAYASFMKGAFFADLLVKDDVERLNFNLPSVPGIPNLDANSLGASLTVGARFGQRLVLEPMATISYVNTRITDLNVPGTTFDWKDSDSLRGQLALRLSGDFLTGDTTLQPFIMGGLGHEFSGDNNLLMTSGGNSLLIADRPVETFGVASLGLNIFGTSGWSGFIRGDGMFGTDYRSGAVRVGIRYAMGAAPPPPPPPAVRTFIVFFDFDRSNLTAEAQQVVAEAVRTAMTSGMVRVVVTGHTDTVGSRAYNQALSERRATAVKDEMVRRGLGMN